MSSMVTKHYGRCACDKGQLSPVQTGASTRKTGSRLVGKVRRTEGRKMTLNTAVRLASIASVALAGSLERASTACDSAGPKMNRRKKLAGQDARAALM